MGSGMTIPFDGIPLAEHREWFEELVALGYTDVWSSEADGTDGFTPLALAAAWTPSLRLGVAIIPVFTRGPAVLAQTVASLAEAAPGRFAMGVGTSSDVIVERWNGIPFVEPYKRARDTVRFLRQALSGEKVDSSFDTFTVRGFRLSRPPAVVPQILVAALRPGMLRLAGLEGDGAIINWPPVGG
jgi:probable F420-dependent oxidoreductase